MTWTCTVCGGHDGALVYYMPLRSSSRRLFTACQRCDMIDLWPTVGRAQAARES